MNEDACELPSVYCTPEANRAIPLAEEEAELCIHDQRVKGNVKAELKFLPSPRVVIEGAFPDCPLKVEDDVNQLRLPSREVALSVNITSVSVPEMRLRMTCKRPATVLDPGEERTEQVRFHLLNFHDFFCDSLSVEVKPNSFIRVDRVVLDTEGWRITISAHRATRDLIKELEDIGGYAITHVGLIERPDGGAFAPADAKSILAALQHFLSFARGFWTSPVLPVAFGAGGQRIWEQWGVGLSEPWHTVRSWFDHQHGALLREVFPGFLGRWQSELWQKPIREAIYWYLASNTASRGTDVGIILTQAGIELLAWVYAVQEKGLISGQGFEKLWASDQMRLLLSSLRIPLEIPSHLERLTALASERQWEDGPHALTALRNSIVHPVRKFDSTQSGLLWEGWNLGLWYLELTFLRLFGHTGQYGNRLVRKFVGEVEAVPWADRPGQQDSEDQPTQD